jgi:hypothetical protein
MIYSGWGGPSSKRTLVKVLLVECNKLVEVKTHYTAA